MGYDLINYIWTSFAILEKDSEINFPKIARLVGRDKSPTMENQFLTRPTSKNSRNRVSIPDLLTVKAYLLQKAKIETDANKLAIETNLISAIDMYRYHIRKVKVTKAFSAEPVVSPTMLELLSRDPTLWKLYDLLYDNSLDSNYDEFVLFRAFAEGMSQYANKLTPFDTPKRKEFKANFFNKLYQKGLVTRHVKGQTTNPVVQELLKAAIGKGLGHHPAVLNIMKDSIYFVAGEFFLQFYDSRRYSGQPDYLLFDGKKFYIADFKPNYQLDTAKSLKDHTCSYSFINGIPQIAVYALIIQQITGIEVECIMFNSDGAITFDPNSSILADINEFMEKYNTGWTPPWSDFT
jgi:hypothetical protein